MTSRRNSQDSVHNNPNENENEKKEDGLET